MTPTEVSEAIKAVAVAIQANVCVTENSGVFEVAKNSEETVVALNKIIIALVNRYQVCEML